MAEYVLSTSRPTPTVHMKLPSILIIIFFLFGQARRALNNHENFIIEGAGMYRDEI